jgi:hypothetical protein
MIDKAYKKIIELHKSGFPNITKEEIHEGDRYYSENGINYILESKDIKLEIGYMYITEDDDNWAQAECYEVKWNRLNDKNITDDKAFEILSNLNQIIREQKLNSIL